MQRIQLYRYIAVNNHEGTKQILSDFGVPQPTSTRDAIQKLRWVLKRHREDALKAMAAQHPDKDLILSMEIPNDAAIDRNVEIKSSNCGCSHSGANGEQKSCCSACAAAANGENGKTKETPVIDSTESVAPKEEVPKKEPSDETGKNLFVKNLPYIAIGMVVLGGIVAFTKKG